MKSSIIGLRDRNYCWQLLALNSLFSLSFCFYTVFSHGIFNLLPSVFQKLQYLLLTYSFLHSSLLPPTFPSFPSQKYFRRIVNIQSSSLKSSDNIIFFFFFNDQSADPNAEVVALSPTTLMATNRFVCEICNKGFQRDQNLQLHRRGHNLPWKLRQRSTTEYRKKVYICPEPTCVHHNPSRALGDLTGIKKHFSRKHGEKKWKCDKCSKKYAVQSDWKAHQKTCGTREYKCDCGTIFSR